MLQILRWAAMRHLRDAHIVDAADAAERDEIYETERRLLYVACTRARGHLLPTGVRPASGYLEDFGSR